MKQFKMMALAAMTLLMGMIMASCLGSSEGDNKATQNVIALYENGTLEQFGGGTLIPKNSNYMPSTPGIYTFGIEYDPTTWKDNKLEVTITSTPISMMNNNVVQGENKGNVNMYDLNYQDELTPVMFNADYILVPVIFWVENVNADAMPKEEAKHHFYLQAPSDLHNEEGILELTIYDVVDDPEVERTKSSYIYQAFNLHHIIEGFKAANGTLKKIRVSAMVNRVSNDPTHGNTVKEAYDIDYK
ncbi:MAG: hypothetical protein IJ256_05005 [Bacteroidaceae bacterium]|nr:hypothetical protein [Bacteroidaceae bacterium]